MQMSEHPSKLINCINCDEKALVTIEHTERHFKGPLLPRHTVETGTLECMGCGLNEPWEHHNLEGFGLPNYIPE